MLKEVCFYNWKSFRESVLYVDPLTILIGTNASGKSNALDGLDFLNRTAQGKDIRAALTGDVTLPAIRGGAEWAALKPQKQFTLSVLVQGEDERTEYLYSLTVETTPRVQLVEEMLTRVKYRPRSDKSPYKIYLFKTDPSQSDSPSIVARLYNEKRGTPKETHRTVSVLSQLNGLSLRKEIAEGVESVAWALDNIFILDPIPHNMRSYSPLSDRLNADASNIAGVLAALPEEKKHQIEKTLSAYASELPERDIRRVWSEPVGQFASDAMLYCEEDWVTGQKPTLVDARGMSDGTLRFLAILTALLTRPERSQLVVEEVDNGLHPSRAGLLLKMLREIGESRKIDVLVTTHNPALLDALGPEMIPFVVVSHRDSKTGESRLTLVESIAKLPKLLAGGPLGKITTQGAIERSLKDFRETEHAQSLGD